MKKGLMPLLLLFCLAFGVPAVAQTAKKTVQTKAKKTPIDFNDELASITDSLYARGSEWGTACQKANTDGNYTTLVPIRKAIQDFVKKKITYVQNHPDVGGSREMQDAMVGFLKFENDLIAKGFLPFEKFNAATTETEKEAALKVLTEASKDEESVLKRIGVAQEAYGKKNNFTIETRSEGGGE